MVEHILTYLIVGSVVLFFEVIFPYGFLMLAAVGLYAIAIFKAWVAFGLTGAVAALVAAIIFAIVTAYWELCMLPRHGALERFPWLRDRLRARQALALAEPHAQLRGAQGVTLSALNPAGQVKINGKSYLAQVSHGGLGEGVAIRVIDVGIYGLRVEALVAPSPRK